MSTKKTSLPVSDYYILRGDSQSGPYTTSQLRSMWHSGSITGDMLFWTDGMKEWQPLSAIKDRLEPLSEPQRVAVRQSDPFAKYHTDIQGKKPGRITFVGILGIGLGILIIACACLMLGQANTSEAQEGVFLTMLMGIGFVVGCFLWARRK
jgi:hypothetical protein